MTDIIDHISHVVSLVKGGLPIAVIEGAIDRSSSDEELCAQIGLLIELHHAGFLNARLETVGPAWQPIGAVAKKSIQDFMKERDGK